MITEHSGGGGDVIGVTGATPGYILKFQYVWLSLPGIIVGVEFDIRAGGPPIDRVVAR